MTEFGGHEIIANGIEEVLTAHLATAITEINTELKDITLPAPSQILSHPSTEATTEAGLPLFAVADMPSTFEDDLVTSLEASFKFYVYVVMQEADQGILVKMLRRYVRAIEIALQKDRTAPNRNETSILGRSNIGVWAVMFEGVQPGPLLGNTDSGPDVPPTAWLSWSGLIITCKREEV